MNTKKLLISMSGILIITLFIVMIVVGSYSTTKNQELYDPSIDPKDFVPTVSHPYFTLNPGQKFTYHGNDEEGFKKIEVFVTSEKKVIMGVETTVVIDREYLNNELIEDTQDWFAQDTAGNVWYFGELSKELEGEITTSTEGSWEAGVNGAKAGIIMKAHPKVGDRYRQEYAKGIAEDWGEVIATDVNLSLSIETYSKCIQTRDWNSLEVGQGEYKYYCPKIGGLVYEQDIESGEGEQLVMIEFDTTASTIEYPATITMSEGVTEEEAKKIAQNKVGGRITDIEEEIKFGRTAYVIELNVDGKEIDVIVDSETGEVLGIEKFE